MAIQDILQQMDTETVQEKRLTSEVLSFAEYLELARSHPSVCRLSHGRLWDMIQAADIISGKENEPAKYMFFENEIFGLEHVFQHLVEEYLSPAAKRLDIRKRILLFVGPVGGGKSTIVTLLKRGLERYSRTPAGAVYAIDGCPMFEDPMHLVPSEHRAAIEKEIGVPIEGDLCPLCQWRLENDWGGQVSAVKVRRVLLLERSRVGIGTFKPADSKSQDVSELVGHINLALLVDPQMRGEGDPRVYRFDGELNVANRGVIEMIEMLKLDPKFLYELNTVCGEQRIKVPAFALIYADLAVIAHTNEYEFKKYFSDPANEAMVDRIFVVKVPYNLRVKDEVRIYEKLIRQGELTATGTAVHIAPQTLQVVSMLAVLSRLKETKKTNLSVIGKLKLYNGEQRVGDYEQKHLRELREEGSVQHEGMEGLSPRFIMNRLSSAMSGGRHCVGPIETMRSLRDGIKAGFDPKEAERLLTLLDAVRKEFDETVKKRVQRAFVDAYEENTEILLRNYLQNVDAFCAKTKLRDQITREEIDPDERLMQSIEEQIGISGESKRKEFREGIMRSVASVVMRGGKFILGSNSTLQEAIEKKLFADLKDVVKITTSTKVPSDEQSKKIDAVLARLTDPSLPEEERYCPECARELLQYAGQLLNR